MNPRSKKVIKIEDTCVICREAKTEKMFNEIRCEYSIPGEDRTQVDVRFYGVCEKCLEMDDVWDIFDVLLDCYVLLYFEIYNPDHNNFSD